MSIKVLVVDDSAFMRQTIKRILQADPEIEVVGVAVDGEDALKKVEFFKPQVITLDLRMPRMDGLAFLTALMRTSPLPVVLVSSWAQEGTEETLRALEFGAVDFVTKPSSEPTEELWQIGDELREKVKAAAHVRVDIIQDLPEKGIATVSPTLERSHLNFMMGASTGGPRASLYPDPFVSRFSLGILIAQHMPREFMSILPPASGSQLRVKIAEEGDLIYPGTVLVAPAVTDPAGEKEEPDGGDIRVHHPGKHSTSLRLMRCCGGDHGTRLSGYS